MFSISRSSRGGLSSNSTSERLLMKGGLLRASTICLISAVLRFGAFEKVFCWLC